MSTVQFDVAYQYSEYRQFLLEHLREVKGISPGFFGRLLFSGVAAIAYAVKRSKMPVCSFTIDHAGIRRRAGGGELVVPWGSVTNIYRYPPGFVIEKGRGAMPIPYRCLDQTQRADLEVLLATRERELSASRKIGDV
jgi:hypothetical protein